MLNFALSLIPKGGNNAPSIYPALKAPISIRNDSLTLRNPKQKSVCKYLTCSMRARSNLVEYSKILICKDLTVIYIFMTTTSDAHYLFYIRDIHKRFFALHSSEVRLSGRRKQCKIQHCFCSQNIRRVFLFKTISLFTT